MENYVSVKEAKEILKENKNKIINKDLDGYVVLKNINKIYDNKVQAVFDFNLSIKKNEFIVLVGPSGCGKSTTLRMVAGLEEITSGYLYIDNVLNNYLESKDRNIAMVFQSYALYPNLNVYENIAFGLRAKHTPNDIVEKKVFEAAEILNLGQYLDRKPRELSGGQMQRVALGRAIVRDSKLFLMDEPLSNLDAKLRVQMRSEIVNLHKRVGATTIYVTHDQTEAMTMADRIVVMNKGVVQQIGTPEEIYNDPSNVFVATFIGNPPMNILKTTLNNNKVLIDNYNFTLPENYEISFKNHIENRVKIFEKLKELSLSVHEDSLELIKLIKNKATFIFKKKNLPTVNDEIKNIIEKLEEFKNKYYFYSYDEEFNTKIMTLLDKKDYKNVKSLLNNIKSSLENVDLQFEGELKKYNSGHIFESSEKEVKVTYKKKKNKEVKKELYELNQNFVAEFLAKYQEVQASNEILLGVRPEDVILVKNEENSITASPFFVELLGSEYCVYYNLNNTKFVMKTSLQNKVKSGETTNIGFNIDKVKIFDPVSGEKIL